MKLTADGEVVIIHDQTLLRTTGQAGNVRDWTLAEIQKLDAGSHFDRAFAGERIPTLAELFEKTGDRALYNIELTNYASLTDSLPEKVAELVQRYHLAGSVLFSSFNPLALIRVRRKLPEAPIGLLARPHEKGNWARSRLGNPATLPGAAHPSRGCKRGNRNRHTAQRQAPACLYRER